MKTHFFAPVTRTLCRLLTVAVLVLIHFGSSSAHAQRMPQDSWYLAKEFRGDIEGGKFHNPHDLALGPDGKLYICDRYNHRIQVFTQDGTFVRKWGSYGSAQGQLIEPSGIFVAQDGNVYVSEAGNNRIQVFDAQGNSLRTMGQSGSGDGQLNYPYGVTVDDAGNVYTADYNNSRVMVFSPDGSYLRQWGGAGDTDGLFRNPLGITRTPDNKIAVCERDGAHRTQVFSTDGTLLFKFTTSGAPHGLKADASGNFYVISRDWNGVWVYDSSGNEIRHFGQNGGGSGNGQFNSHGLAVGNGKAFIGDWDNHRIAVFTTDGTFVKNFGSYGDVNFSTPYGMATDAQGNVYISDCGNNQIRKYDKDLNYLGRFGTGGSSNGQFNAPFCMAVSPDQKLYVVDRGNHRVQILDLDGNYIGKFGQNGSGNSQFNNPWGIAISKDGRVYVADQSNHRVEVFDGQGNFLKKFGKEGNFDGQLESPQDIVILPNNKLYIGDRGNGRIQIFDLDGKYLNKSGWNPDRICGTFDGDLYGCWNGGFYNRQTIIDHLDVSSLNETKQWGVPSGGYWGQSGSVMELSNGDVLSANYEGILRLWKRTYRIAVPDNGNALPLPAINAQKRRPGTTLVDIDYTVKDADNANVSTALLAFQNGGNSLNDIVPIRTLAEGTGANLGSNIPTGVTNRVTWDVAKDWSTNYGNLQLEVLAKDNRSLLNIDFLQIPGYTNATTTNPPLKISRSPLNDNDFLSAWYWLVASGDPSVSFKNGTVMPDSQWSFTAPSDTTPGLWVTRYSNPNWSGNTQSKVETSINFARGSDFGDLNNAGGASIYVGMVTPPTTGTYQFFIDADDVVNWSINGQYGQQDGGRPTTITLQAGVPVPLVINYNDIGGGWRSMNVRWITPGQTDWASVPDNVYSTAVSQPTSSSYGASGPLASGTSTTPAGRAFLFAKMGLREATQDELKRAREAGTPGVINRWAPKFQVGPGERPAAVNAYGFDTGADGYWVVPITVTNNAAN